jgi:ankyrin repeat protein
MSKFIKIKVLSAVAFLSVCFAGCNSTKTPHQMIRDNEIEAAKGQFQMPSDINGIDKDGNTVLHLAAERDDADLITYFMIKGADSELKNYNSDTALHVAVANDKREAAKALISMGANIFSRNADGKTALDLAISKDEAYYDIFVTTKTGEIRDVEGKTIVHYFVETFNNTGVEYCIKKKIPISVKDNYERSPLDLAFENIENYDVVQIIATLIYGGAEPVKTNYDYFQEALISRNLSYRFDDGQTPLHFGAIEGHNSIVKFLLENNANQKSQDSAGNTPLHDAIRYGNLEIAKMLLDSGAYINAKDNLGKTPILLIIPKDKLFETYTFLIKYNANLNEKDMFGDTVLHTAAMLNSDSSVVELLVSNGADVNARNKEGVTPLEIALKNGDISTIKYLAENGANIHTQNTRGESPLSLALASESNELLEAIVNETNVLLQNSDGNTPLHIALMNDASLLKVQYIISLSNDVNIRNKNGNSALFYAVMKNRKKVGEILLEKNADIFSTNTNNNSPLRLALKYGGSIQDWLITSKTIKATDGSGNTALHYAAEWEYSDAIVALLQKGSDIHTKNANGETALFNAVKTNNPNIIQLIVDGGADLSVRDNLGSVPLHTAVRWDAEKSVIKLIELGVDVNAQNIAGKSALSEACITGKNDLAKLLLDSAADSNASDINGVTILMDAIRGQNNSVVKLLLSYGANPNVQEINGKNSYHEAAATGNKSIIKLIRDAGGNPLARDKNGKTPFSVVMNDDFDIIKCVLGNNYTITDSDGNTPIHLVVKQNASVELLEFLIKDGYPIDTRNANGYTALNYAIENDNIKLSTMLLENGANPFKMIDKKGRNGVSIALEKNNKLMISNIVKYAGELADIQGNTILHYAAKSCSEDVIKTLLSFGLDKNVKNVSGDTAYTIAVRWKRSDILDLLK